MRSYRRLLAVGFAAAALPLLVLVVPAEANHSWGNYHWARTANPLTLDLGDNLTSTWDPYLATTSTDWTKSTVLDTRIVASGRDPRKCRPVAGRVEVCNAAYGRNGWLGIASIWASSSHITQATVKVNDSYYSLAKYNTPAWRNFVMCQEVGHVFGLDHQDENFNNANLGSCMDYTNDPGSNQHPNAHDYAQLESIYAHTDSTNTSTSTASSTGPGRSDAGGGNSQGEWGTAIRYDEQGRPSLFARQTADGQMLFTFVVWA